MPIDYSKYPPNWLSEIRPRILKRARNRCEFCEVKNGKMVRGLSGKMYKTILTIAHLDHDEKNWEVQDHRLAALCQPCHLRYDAKEKSIRKQEKKESDDNQLRMFE